MATKVLHLNIDERVKNNVAIKREWCRMFYVVMTSKRINFYHSFWLFHTKNDFHCKEEDYVVSIQLHITKADYLLSFNSEKQGLAH